MSCVIEHEGSEYMFVKENRYWIGYRRLNGVNFVGENVVAPLLIQNLLLKAAIAAGFPSDMFRAPVKKAKSPSRRSGSSKKNSSAKSNAISIF